MKDVRNYVKSTIDLHVHSGYDIVNRLLSDEEAVQEALSLKMRGLLLKAHIRDTYKSCKEIEKRLFLKNFVFGCVVLNFKNQLNDVLKDLEKEKGGIRLIYMPTIMANNKRNHQFNANKENVISIVNGEKQLIYSIKEIIKKASETYCTIATGHINEKERESLLEFCFKVGIKTIIITHPEYFATAISIKKQKEIALRWPNSLFERTLYSVIDEEKARNIKTFLINKRKFKKLISGIEEVGPDRTVISSDFGQVFNMAPVKALNIFIENLLKAGISEKDIARMTKINPMRCLGLYNEMIKEYLAIVFIEYENRFKSQFRIPIVGFANADDPLFNTFQKVVHKNHSLPSDILNGAVSVVSLFLPFGEKIIKSNLGKTKPSPEWCLAYTEGNKMLDILSSNLGNLINQCGFKYAKHSAFHHLSGLHEKEVELSLLYSTWSQRHVAYACGLGTFGTNNMLITKQGCSGRYTSLVSTMPLTPSEKLTEEFCLAKRGESCYLCIERCPVKALSPTGFDRMKCWQYLVDNNDVSRRNNIPVVNVCGKCCTKVPCAY